MFLSFTHERWSQMHAHEHGSRRRFLTCANHASAPILAFAYIDQ